MWLFIFKVIVLILVIVFTIIFPLVICYKCDLDGTLMLLTRTRYDEKRRCELGDNVYKVIVYCSASSFIFGAAAAFTLLSVVS